MTDTLIAEYMEHGDRHRLVKRTTRHAILLLDYNGRPDPALIGKFTRREQGVLELATDYLQAENKQCRDYDPTVDLQPDPEPVLDPVQLTHEADGDHAYLGIVDGHATWVLTTPTTPPTPITLHDICGHFETYVPFVNATRWATRTLKGQSCNTRLKQQLRALDTAKTILNRRLRETIQTQYPNKTDIGRLAAACGRVNKQGYGETSWLNRRAGITPDADTGELRRWVYSTTLARIAEAMNIPPHELELQP